MPTRGFYDMLPATQFNGAIDSIWTA